MKVTGKCRDGLVPLSQYMLVYVQPKKLVEYPLKRSRCYLKSSINKNMLRLTVVSIDQKKKNLRKAFTCIIKISWFIFGVFI